MVGMTVRVKHRIHAGELVAQRLFAKIGTGIDENDAVARAIVPLQQHGWPQPSIVRVRRSTHGATAPQRGNSHGSPGAEKCQLAVHYP